MNDLAGRPEGASPGAEREVDTALLRSKLKSVPRDSVVYGHLLPYCLDPSTVGRVVVLRCEPMMLRKRLQARGYPPRKVEDNVEAELIGLISDDSFRAFGEKAFEVDTTSFSAKEAAALAFGVVSGDRKAGERIDWTLGYDTGAKLRSLLPSSAA